MVKRRPVVVLASHKRNSKLVAVVPLSTTRPEPVEEHHYRLLQNPLPDPSVTEVWAKCDMVAVVSTERLELIRTGRKLPNGKREYLTAKIGQEQFDEIRRGVASEGIYRRPESLVSSSFIMRTRSFAAGQGVCRIARKLGRRIGASMALNLHCNHLQRLSGEEVPPENVLCLLRQLRQGTLQHVDVLLGQHSSIRARRIQPLRENLARRSLAMHGALAQSVDHKIDAILNRYARWKLTSPGSSSCSRRTYASCATSCASASERNRDVRKLTSMPLCLRKRCSISAARDVSASGESESKG